MAGSEEVTKSTVKELATPIEVDKLQAGASSIVPRATPEISAKGKAGDDSWNPNDFCKDATYFAENFGLPNDGEKPHSINDISDESLSQYFGPKTRNGYKLSNCTGIPIDDIIHLSQVVDGYEKPVNGVLSHTFVKGVVAERIEKRRINWAAYAATKLKGQVLQREREKRGKPDGPPCIRKPRSYIPAVERVPIDDNEETKQAVRLLQTASLSNSISASLVAAQCLQSERVTLTANEDSDALKPALSIPALSIPSARTDRPVVAVPGPEFQPRSLLFAIVQSALESSKVELSKVLLDVKSGKKHLVALQKAELQIPIMVEKISKEIDTLEGERITINGDIVVAQGVLEDTTIYMELEDNKEDEDEGAVTGVMDSLQRTLDLEKGRLHLLQERQAELPDQIRRLEDLRVQKERRAEHYSNLRVRLDKSGRVLRRTAESLERTIVCQEEELSHLERLISSPCPQLSPRFIPTSTHSGTFQVSVSSCPICCNGYHCSNWIPTSCGHTYHPACLFQYLGGSSVLKKCHACGCQFANDWLRCWGLPVAEEECVDNPSEPDRFYYANELRTLYGRRVYDLSERRKLQKLFESTQGKNDGGDAAELYLSTVEDPVVREASCNAQRNASSNPGSCLKPIKLEDLDDFEDGSKRKAAAELEQSTKQKAARKTRSRKSTF